MDHRFFFKSFTAAILSILLGCDSHYTEVTSTPQGANEEKPKTTLPLEANWNSVSTNIIFPLCYQCHSPEGKAKAFDFSTRQAIFALRNATYEGRTLLDFDNPSESLLVTSLTDEKYPMPPLNTNLRRVTPDETQILIEWIRLGLP